MLHSSRRAGERADDMPFRASEHSFKYILMTSPSSVRVQRSESGLGTNLFVGWFTTKKGKKKKNLLNFMYKLFFGNYDCFMI